MAKIPNPKDVLSFQAARLSGKRSPPRRVSKPVEALVFTDELATELEQRFHTSNEGVLVIDGPATADEVFDRLKKLQAKAIEDAAVKKR